jgi:rubredoxin
MKMWRCTVCGLIVEAETPPDVCPRCGAPREKFAELTEDQVTVVRRSRATNQLHLDLLTRIQQIEAIADAGIEDNLDPGCLGVFRKAKEMASLVRQFGKAEIQVHVNKGKWG